MMMLEYGKKIQLESFVICQSCTSGIRRRKQFFEVGDIERAEGPAAGEVTEHTVSMMVVRSKLRKPKPYTGYVVRVDGKYRSELL